jgi:UDP-N-acetylglucosamine--N-acetylmuramyl-(pentapeptide) pyrophosphoryl-undecaprenol N-acetylglucosamine transferase
MFNLVAASGKNTLKFSAKKAKLKSRLHLSRFPNNFIMSEKIFVVSGGTGGHIIPARCLADYLTSQNKEVIFFGDSKIKSYTTKSDCFKTKIISCAQFKKSLPEVFASAIKIYCGILQSLYFLLKIKPQSVVAFGGYATFPMLLAAVITKNKIIIHEQNAHLGKVNRIFSKYADKIALSFAETSGIAAQNMRKTFMVGNLVRQEILDLNNLPAILPPPQIEDSKQLLRPESDNKMGYNVVLASDFYVQPQVPEAPKLFNILVIGGSGGAKIFSEILPKAFFNLSTHLKERIKVTQQCRAELLQSTFEQYKSFNINIVISSFFDNMAELLKNSQLVIGRCGSSSVFEFCAAKKPMILVPFANSADDHQEKNARYFEKHGAAIVVREPEFTINKINEILKNLIDNQEILKKMSQNASFLAVPDATKNLSSLI